MAPEGLGLGVTVNPHATEREIPDIRGWNEAMVAKHDPEAYHLHSSWPIRIIEKMRVGAVLKALQGKESGDVLEIGCGAGNVLEKVEAAKRVGIDFSLRMAQRTRERLRAGGTLWVLQADGQVLPFQDQSFDGILCTEVLEHVENPDLLLSEIRRVARPDAAIALSIPNENLINQLKEKVFRLGLDRILLGGKYEVPERMDDEWHLHVFDLKELVSKLSKNFLIKKITPIPSPLLPLRYVIAGTPESPRR